MPARDLEQWLHVDPAAEEMGNDDRPGAGVDSGLQLSRIARQREGLDINRNDDMTEGADDPRHVADVHSRHDDLARLGPACGFEQRNDRRSYR
jgi:hypothetical protein